MPDPFADGLNALALGQQRAHDTQHATAHAALHRALRPALDSGDAPAALGAAGRILATFDGHHTMGAELDHFRALAALRVARLTLDAS